MIDMKCAECGRDLWGHDTILVRPKEQKAYCSPECRDVAVERDPSVIVIAPGPAKLGLVSA